MPLTLESFSADGVQSLTLELLTPLRLKFQNRLQAELPFHLLIRAALRRIAALYHHFADGEPARRPGRKP